MAGQYDQTIDRESAFEMLQKRAAEAQQAEEEVATREGGAESGRSRWTLPDFGGSGNGSSTYRGRPRASNRQTIAEAAIKSVVRSVGSSLGRALVRGILGGLKRGF